MELAETIDTINRQLVNLFGIDDGGRPIFRVVWSNDQFEKRMIEYTDSGIQLLTPQVRTLPKYRQWIQNRYVLERLVVVPDMNRTELADAKISYEPLYVFQNSYTDEYLPPTIVAAKFVIDGVLAAQGKKSMRKYVDENEKHPIEAREQRINKLQAELFGEDKVSPLEHGGGVFIAAKETKLDDAASPNKE